MSVLWRWQELLAATGLEPSGKGIEVTGVSIDTRTLQPGDLFIALSGDPGPGFTTASSSGRDGHEFLETAIRNQAGAIMVSQEVDYDVPTLKVDNTLRGLWDIGAYSRQRSIACITAITGSSGKTTARYFLQKMLEGQGSTHASIGSYNNHWGVPLSLARMPADSRYGVFEIGMNHPGEIRPLAELVSPDVALVLNVLPVHLGYFDSIDAVRKEKLSIVAGLKPGGHLVVSDDVNCSDIEQISSIKRLTFGKDSGADSYPLSVVRGDVWQVSAKILGEEVSFRLQSGGDHRVQTALATLTLLKLMGGDINDGAEVLGHLEPPEGRGNEHHIRGVTIIDDSYNANPKSMREALQSLASRPGRKIAMIGDMLELGEAASRFHRELSDVVNQLDRVYLVGDEMTKLADPCKDRVGAVYQGADQIDIQSLISELREGDHILVKGSNRIFWQKGFVRKLRDALDTV